MEVILKDVWFSYDGLTYALRGINLGITEPGLYIIIGPNGAGKTTLLKIVSLMMRPTRGAVLINGRDFWGLGDEEKALIRRNIVFVHDRPILLRGSVKYNVELGLRIRGAKGGDVIHYYVSRYGLEGILNKPTHKLSAGQAKAVSIVRALALRPPILVLDEPFTYLDEVRQELLLEDIKVRVKENVTTIIATHYMYKELLDISSNIVELTYGEVIKFIRDFNEFPMRSS